MASMPTRAASASEEFHELYTRHYGFVWQAVRRFGVTPPLTDDAVQDTFVVAYRRFEEVAMTTAKGWLYGIARRVASNYRRADHRSVRKRRALALAGEPPRSAAPELTIMLERFLAGLTPEDRELFVLSEIEGMSGPETADALALNLNTAYSRVQSLRRRFRAAMVDVDPNAMIDDARRERPRATAHGWAALLPQLGLASAPKLVPWVSLAALAKLTTIAVPVAAAVTIGLGWANAPVSEAPPGDHTESVALPSEPVVVAAAATVPAVVPSQPTHVASELAVPAAGHAPVKAPTELASLERHNALLRDAAAQLRSGAADDALASIAAHTREFPDSSLADARTVLRIEALCAQGKPAQARGEAKLFVTEHPDSVLRERIARSCASTVVDPGGAGQSTG